MHLVLVVETSATRLNLPNLNDSILSKLMELGVEKVHLDRCHSNFELVLLSEPPTSLGNDVF